MASEDNKNYSLNLSSQMILGLIVTFLPIIGGAAYTGINFWAKMNKTIEAVDKFKPYDDTQFKERQQAFEIEIKSLKERQLALAEQAVRVAEKSSDAIALAKETRAIGSHTRGIQAMVIGMPPFAIRQNRISTARLVNA